MYQDTIYQYNVSGHNLPVQCSFYCLLNLSLDLDQYMGLVVDGHHQSGRLSVCLATTYYIASVGNDPIVT